MVDSAGRPVFDFEKLDVYRKALSFTNEVYRVTKDFPREEQFGVVAQLRRAAVSIAQNLAEGCGRRSKNDRRHFFDMARSSIYECIPLLQLSEQQRFFHDGMYDKLYEDSTELSRMLSGLISSLR